MTGAANGNIVADLSGNIDTKVGNQVSAMANANINRSIEHGWLFLCWFGIVRKWRKYNQINIVSLPFVTFRIYAEMCTSGEII